LNDYYFGFSENCPLSTDPFPLGDTRDLVIV